MDKTQRQMSYSLARSPHRKRRPQGESFGSLARVDSQRDKTTVWLKARGSGTCNSGQCHSRRRAVSYQSSFSWYLSSARAVSVLLASSSRRRASARGCNAKNRPALANCPAQIFSYFSLISPWKCQRLTSLIWCRCRESIGQTRCANPGTIAF